MGNKAELHHKAQHMNTESKNLVILFTTATNDFVWIHARLCII